MRSPRVCLNCGTSFIPIDRFNKQRYCRFDCTAQGLPPVGVPMSRAYALPGERVIEGGVPFASCLRRMVVGPATVRFEYDDVSSGKSEERGG